MSSLEVLMQSDKETASFLLDFLNDLTVDGLSDNSIKAFRSFLPSFFLDVGKKPFEVKREDVYNWLQVYKVHKNGKPKAARTINQRLILLKIFFDYCIDEINIVDSPVYLRWMIKLPQTMPRHLSEVELTKLKVEMEEMLLRNRAIVSVFLDTGYRNSELASIRIDDISLKERTIFAETKGKKKRIAFITNETANILKMLMDSLPKGKEHIFLNKYGNKITPRSIQRIMNQIGEKIGLNRSLTPHDLRHTFATVTLEKGASLELVQELMDHANINTTRIYARASSKQKRALYDKFRS
ncbi:tyrosine-type recombinase/integrase [Dethiobacter alkaliphilus]|uniref:tyrosine-type recombinase/integrase n=1 Tax=Dethiobacter alkaliphilus TaxID=427926 RepID=UPI0022265B56|nr:tyrosine-type recombinase/integrase [Dethiobacter alkaliphilus]MCW3491533.1 tyrosine-type recombinase/integrase [Dethiobacter alkaliphilus]